MRKFVVPVLLLVTVAVVSSSNEIPMLSIHQLETEPLGFNGQQDDNISSNKQHSKNILNDLFYNIFKGTLNDGHFNVPRTPQLKYTNMGNIRNFDDYINKDENYNGEGFRKEQWHNYPRQLDRLHKYLYAFHNSDTKRSPDPDNPDSSDDGISLERPNRDINHIATNELLVDSNDGTHNFYDSVVATTNPFLILKIRLACLNNGIENKDPSQYSELLPIESKSKNEIETDDDGNIFTNDINPVMNMMKVKREGVSSLVNSNLGESPMNGKKAVKKRIFSLWSRLQSLNHKGHELHHRRHLHAFYGLPDGDGGGGGGVLTAETRATLMRPPGSPLRWG